MERRHSSKRALFLCGAAAIAFGTLSGPAQAAKSGEAAQFRIQPQSLKHALLQFSEQSGHDVLVGSELTRSRISPGFSAPSADPDTALRQVLSGTGLSFRRDGDTFVIVRAETPRAPVRLAAAPAVAAETVTGSAVEGLVVTAQKRRENIQDVPIAISAFTQDALTVAQVAGGPDLMTQVPNVTFTKTNFSGYSIQIRGIGTQAISATVDPAVAVAFNNTSFIRNRFFEQEFYDLERVEVLRGPQGTLYGRNATAGVVNILSAKPNFLFEAKASADVGDYAGRRLEGMINIPLVEDKAALRLAGAWTKRDGFVKNILTGEQTDGRDLVSMRASLRLDPTDRFSANLIYERFSEDDDRLRSGKQLCHKDPGPDELNGVPVPHDSGSAIGVGDNYLSQGCKPASLYSPDSFETPNGHALVYYGPAGQIGSPVHQNLDPYLNATQSRDLREIETHLTPEYTASSHLGELQLRFDLSEGLALTSETAFSRDELFSFGDFNRFDTTPGVFVPRSTVVDQNGVFCDPQLGCTDRLAAGDLSTAKSQQFSQEFRLSSSLDGPFNFNLGANFLRYDTEDKYYVFINSLTVFPAATATVWIPGVTDNARECLGLGRTPSDPNVVHQLNGCDYIDPNDIHNLNDQGRNYFLSKNPYHLLSYSAFGEAYYNITPDLKLTAGFRWTMDHKKAPLIPSWLYAPQTYGTPTRKVIEEEWREPTGRLAIDWKPKLSFTDETLVYASYVRGYKAGGANPPPPVVVLVFTEGFDDAVLAASFTHPETFEPEFVNAYEVGTKNALLDGKLTVNLGAFYYDYTGYQISQIVDRSAVNLNFDAEVWGAELEADWRPVENLRFGLKIGYERTRLADGSNAIDLMDRTAGHEGWTLFKPFPPMPSNCIIPTEVAALALGTTNAHLCAAYFTGLDPMTDLPYVKDPQVWQSDLGPVPTDAEHRRGGADLTGYAGFDPTSAPNNGEGFSKDLSGNELPNAPRYTGTFTADYTVPLPQQWQVTLHGDFYYQAEAWTRIFNTDGYDKLKAYTNVNFAAIFNNEASGLQVMAYVKNVFDRDSITGAFLNSDDTGLTTNVFLTEPRLYGVRVTKQWTGAPFLGGLIGGSSHEVGEPYPFTLEFGGGPSREKAANQIYAPSWIDTFRPSAGFPLSPQSDGLDWGEQGMVKLTYAPNARYGWRFSLAARYGKTKGEHSAEVHERAPDACMKYDAQGNDITCGPGPMDWATDDVRDREGHTLIDFMIGKEVGLGVLGEGGSSSVAVGVRYADLSSRTDIVMHSDPDPYFPPHNGWKYDRHWHHYDVDFAAERRFTGVGPQVSWEASRRLFDGKDLGEIDIDWSLGGGVQFGKQKTAVRTETTGDYTTGIQVSQHVEPIYELAERRERKSASVPNVNTSLGLSFAVDRLKIGAGYRWERYFNAIDGGTEAKKTYDRTLDGPYFKVSVGFGD